MNTSVLVIDDDQSMCEMLQSGLEKFAMDVDWRTTAVDALDLIADRDFDVVITDLNLEHTSGLDVCRRVTENRPDVPVIVITAFGDMQSAIAAIRSGAYDFINKPLELEALAHAIKRAAQHRKLGEEVRRLTDEVDRARGAGALVGRSPAMKRVYDLIRRLSDSDASTLLTGESGTGKEMVARALHSEGGRRGRPFMAINCAAVPAHLLESELFGHTKGAFTDARSARKGLFLEADGGSVLLDEIGEMSPQLQPKLLRVLQEHAVRPVGGDSEIPFDARVIAATNRDIESDVEEGRFREDLYYRLNVVQIHVPPLRARGNDILLLAQHFIQEFAKRMDKPVHGLTSEAAKKLLAYDWPGNVRQLENFMERAVTLTRFDQITVDDLPDRIKDYESTKLVLADTDAEHMLTLHELERHYIERVLNATGGNKSQAARVLGLDRRTLYRKLDRYDSESN